MHCNKSKAPSTILVLFYHNQVVIFPFYPKTKQKQVDAKVGRSHAPPWVMVAVCCYSLQVPKKKCSSFFYIFYVPTVFLTSYAGSRDFQIWYSRRSQRVILMLFFFGTFPKFTCLVVKRNLSPVSLLLHFILKLRSLLGYCWWTIANAFYAVSQGALPFLFMKTNKSF